MKITLDIPDGMICAVFNGVQRIEGGLQLVSFQFSTDDLQDGNILKRQIESGENN